ncbi:MAG TPA: tRNA uridine-5-carboxymethylaminomethyl(34) synthesis GTPase MnmE [Vicinamibacterales bacterium]|nr:tRNA uridine-5-carboxymethylaminomethyl(34) synthesis GTPase MnmE [Vicinamibacterales bacterium]
MFSVDDTIVAVATPPGRGGIGVVRVSGPAAFRIAAALTGRSDGFEPRRATLAPIRARDGRRIDRAVVTTFPHPHSYTGEDVAELSAHGSPIVLEAIVGEAMAAGARLAEPGEFTLRAYLNGRIDLVQAEAVADLIDAVTPLQARVAADQLDGTLTGRIAEVDALLLDLVARLEASLDFPDEGYHFITPDGAAHATDRVAAAIDDLLTDAARGRMIREGCTVAILGRPNVGKSTLFNRLAGAPRAIVTDIPGTTRDLVTERVDIAGVPFTIVDTAGSREAAADAVEQEGISRARTAGAAADVVVVVLDAAEALADDDRALLARTAHQRRVVVANKRDLARAWDPAPIGGVPVSAMNGDGLEALAAAILAAADAEPTRDRAAIANVRHAALLRSAREAVGRAREAALAGASEEFLLADLHEARASLEEVTGRRTAEDVLQAIFGRFCIGK